MTAVIVFCEKMCSVSLGMLLWFKLLRDFNGNQNSGFILFYYYYYLFIIWFDIDTDLFKPVKNETVLSISRSGALGHREL